jgi:hypothetical protein
MNHPLGRTPENFPPAPSGHSGQRRVGLIKTRDRHSQKAYRHWLVGRNIVRCPQRILRPFCCFHAPPKTRWNRRGARLNDFLQKIPFLYLTSLLLKPTDTVSIMTTQTTTGTRLHHRFHEGVKDYSELLAPLQELSESSTTLLPGYAASQHGWNKREDLIPYYHVLGKTGEKDPTRILLLAGWLGTEEIASYALLRLIAVLEERFLLVDGIEATIFPIINLEARRQGEEKTVEQLLQPFVLWEKSEVRAIRVVEKELWRYDYDLALHVIEAPQASEFSIQLWAQTADQRTFLQNVTTKHRATSPGYDWQVQPPRGYFPPRLAPVPERNRQPIEVALHIPGELNADQQAEETIGLLLYLMHELRDAQQRGLL